MCNPIQTYIGGQWLCKRCTASLDLPKSLGVFQIYLKYCHSSLCVGQQLWLKVWGTWCPSFPSTHDVLQVFFLLSNSLVVVALVPTEPGCCVLCQLSGVLTLSLLHLMSLIIKLCIHLLHHLHSQDTCLYCIHSNLVYWYSDTIANQAGLFIKDSP